METIKYLAYAVLAMLIVSIPLFICGGIALVIAAMIAD